MLHCVGGIFQNDIGELEFQLVHPAGAKPYIADDFNIGWLFDLSKFCAHQYSISDDCKTLTLEKEGKAKHPAPLTVALPPEVAAEILAVVKDGALVTY
jgi:hypothetical protein